MNFNQLKAIANECVFSMEGITVMKTKEYDYRLQQIERLNNIINELEKWLEENESFDDYCNETTFTSVLDKLQELKENK